jgi:hypothetical protein
MDDRPLVREAAARNPNATHDQLNKASNDAEYDVRDVAKRNLESRK